MLDITNHIAVLRVRQNCSAVANLSIEWNCLVLQGIRAGAGTSRKEDCALVRTDVNVKSRTRVESVGSKTG